MRTETQGLDAILDDIAAIPPTTLRESTAYDPNALGRVFRPQPILGCGCASCVSKDGGMTRDHAAEKATDLTDQQAFDRLTDEQQEDVRQRFAEHCLANWDWDQFLCAADALMQKNGSDTYLQEREFMRDQWQTFLRKEMARDQRTTELVDAITDMFKPDPFEQF